MAWPVTCRECILETCQHVTHRSNPLAPSTLSLGVNLARAATIEHQLPGCVIARAKRQDLRAPPQGKRPEIFGRTTFSD
ncbi:hypothetical protein ElyMa_005694900 [Elysia marginata]|uniref:Uncharacterized protein n=1 Tax=Elysia marginata TaxID=1093978 RepID=A0AAV4FGX5_9GAST|nr:hypothetical protein ElyMa_005694900 [Elysia marginata]